MFFKAQFSAKCAERISGHQRKQDSAKGKINGKEFKTPAIAGELKGARPKAQQEERKDQKYLRGEISSRDRQGSDSSSLCRPPVNYRRQQFCMETSLVGALADSEPK